LRWPTPNPVQRNLYVSADSGGSRVSLKEFVAGTGVILSLLFVGLEIRQNTAAVRSSTLQALSDSHRELVLGSLLSEDHSALIARTLQGETTEDFTDHENTRLLGYYVVYVSHLQNTYMQREAGVVNDAVFEAYGWNGAPIHTAHFEEFQERALATAASPAFAQFFREWRADHNSKSGIR
jgi:hypothetical protein